MKTLTPQIGFQALLALLTERSPLGPLRVMFRHFGYFFRIPLAGFRPLVVSGPQANRQVSVTDRGKLLWHNDDPVTELLRGGLLVVDGAGHDRLRALMDRPLAPAHLPDLAALICRQVERVSAAWPDGGVVDLLLESRRIALLVIMQALFGVDVWDDLPRMWKPVLKAIAFISPGPWILWRRIPRPGYRRPLRELDDYLYGIIAARRAAPPGPDLLSHLIAAGLDDPSLRDQMLTLLIAGHDTSTALLAWTFVLLGRHPEIHAALVSELDRALDGRPPLSSSGWQPQLLDQVIKESLRLYPPIHLGNRTSAEEVRFEAGSLPAGSRLFYSIYLSHRDPAHWERPDDFCPARFAPGQPHTPFAYLPFGGGPRTCIGASFGMAEARLVLTRLLQLFEFQPVGPQARAHMGATLEPRPGVYMRVRRRPGISPA